jgi:hypothetical protein
MEESGYFGCRLLDFLQKIVLTPGLYVMLGVPNEDMRFTMAAPKMMKAAMLTAYNAPIEIRDVPRPEPKADEVLVKI